MYMLVEFCQLVIGTDEPAFRMSKGQKNPVLVQASRLVKFFKNFPYFSALNDEELIFSPDIALFFEAYRTYPSIQCFRFWNPNVPTDEGIRQGELYDGFIAWMRQLAIEQGTRKKICDWRRGSLKNAKRLRDFTESLFKEHSRLVVVRNDLLYHKTVLSPETASFIVDRHYGRAALGMVVPSIEETAAHFGHVLSRVDVREARADLRAFLKALRRSHLTDHLVGYAWCMEWSRVSGHHFHTVLFYDGAKREADVYLGEEVDKLWKVVTQGRGFGHNCNRDRKKYPRWALGRVERNEPAKRAVLDESLSYLVKRTQVVRAKPTGKCRTFQTTMLKPKKKSSGRTQVRRPSFGRVMVPLHLRASAVATGGGDG